MVLKKTFLLNLLLVIPPFFIEFHFFFGEILEGFVPGVKLKKSAVCCPVNGASFICLTGFSRGKLSASSAFYPTLMLSSVAIVLHHDTSSNSFNTYSSNHTKNNVRVF